MARTKFRLTRFELELMDVFWKIGRSSVREIMEALPDRRRPAYTTVQTIVYRLEEKGAVRRVKKIGNALIFEPAMTRAAAHWRHVEDILDLFGGSAQPLVSYLVESGKLTLADLKAIEHHAAKKEKA
jgi:BlaI family transcriptional regulator, penicillinase repressor